MVKYFLKAVDEVNKNGEAAYWLDSKVIDLHSFLSIRDKSDLLHYIIGKENIADIFRYFSKTQALSSIFPYLNMLKYVPQNKGKSKNAFDHTLRVLNVTPFDDIDLRWAALFHDLGKYDSYSKSGDFLEHQYFSYKIAEGCCHLYDIANSDKICSVVRNHMYPLDYQRNPNWSDEAVRRFIKRCKAEYALATVDFAFYDKRAERDVKEFLKPLVELKDRVQGVLDEQEK